MVLQTNHAAQYANRVLNDLGISSRIDRLSDHPALAWRRSGLLQITQLMLPMPLASHADGVLMALQALSPKAGLGKSGAQILGERARLRQTFCTSCQCAARQCAGGYGRLMDTSNGRIVLNLVREEDWDLLPAWLESSVDDWENIAVLVQSRDTDYLVARARELGLAVAEDRWLEAPRTWFSTQTFDRATLGKSPLIVDLSGLWAGPLASSLLMMTGARVIKVESPKRQDGMRLGHKGFYDLINAGKDCVALNFHDADDLTKLKQLIARADIVIEASRPRALPQIGIVAEDFVARKPGKIWARLTAYGQSENHIGFGDDIGISAGLATVMERAYGQPCFVGDAIADPVNGLHLALAIQAHFIRGGGVVMDLSMRDVLRYAMGDVTEDLENWIEIARQDEACFYAMRSPHGLSKPVGADNETWLC